MALPTEAKRPEVDNVIACPFSWLGRVIAPAKSCHLPRSFSPAASPLKSI